MPTPRPFPIATIAALVALLFVLCLSARGQPVASAPPGQLPLTQPPTEGVRPALPTGPVSASSVLSSKQSPVEVSAGSEQSAEATRSRALAPGVMLKKDQPAGPKAKRGDANGRAKSWLYGSWREQERMKALQQRRALYGQPSHGTGNQRGDFRRVWDKRAGRWRYEQRDRRGEWHAIWPKSRASGEALRPTEEPRLRGWLPEDDEILPWAGRRWFRWPRLWDDWPLGPGFQAPDLDDDFVPLPRWRGRDPLELRGRPWEWDDENQVPPRDLPDVETDEIGLDV